MDASCSCRPLQTAAPYRGLKREYNVAARKVRFAGRFESRWGNERKPLQRGGFLVYLDGRDRRSRASAFHPATTAAMASNAVGTAKLIAAARPNMNGSPHSATS